MQASMVAKTQVQLTAEQLRYIADNFDANNKNFSIKNFLDRKVNMLPDGSIGDAPLTLTGLRVPSGIEITAATSYRELYAAQHARYNFPKQSLFENRCLSFCPDGFTDVNGFCLACSSPCATCDGGRDRCLTCLQDSAQNPERKFYAFGRACYTECPVNTVTDEANKRCLGCASGCRICQLADQDICIVCQRPLLLLNSTCVPICPDGYRANFLRTQCDEANDVPVIYFPFLILTALVFLISWMGKKSSKNISGQHRVILSFYCLAAFIDVMSIWALLILVLAQGAIWQIAFPAVGLVGNYYLNHCYIRLWNELDPPKPKDDDELTLKEVIRINKCDQYFDRWNEKYFKVANVIKKLVMFTSHKIFMLPYTHFYGFLHLTVRIQNYYMNWEWNIEKV